MSQDQVISLNGFPNFQRHFMSILDELRTSDISTTCSN